LLSFRVFFAAQDGVLPFGEARIDRLEIHTDKHIV
jgi:hypothetical protein